VTADTHPDVRAGAVAGLRDGAVQWIVNVGTMTEGVDVPSADTAVIARPVGTTGLWLQMAGRILRPDGDGPQVTPVVHDLCGSVWLHGDPCEDRAYSLRGDGISRPRKRSRPGIVTCDACWYVYRPASCCPKCGATKARLSTGKRVDLSELVTIYAGSDTPAEGIAQQVDAWRASGMHWRKVRARCRELYGSAPVVPWAPVEDRRAEYAALCEEAHRTGRSLGWAAHRYRGIFGAWPGT